MAITRRSIGGDTNDGERAGDHHRSSKRRRRLPPIDEEEEERTRMATVRNDSQDAISDGQSGRSSSSKSPQSVKLQSSDLLDCPTCCEPLKRPIYQCTNGHIACSSCCTKLKKKCSFCKSPIGDIRCRAVEKIIEATIVPCVNAIYGCKETTTYGNQSNHHEKKLCVFTQCFCPLPNCDYIGSYKDLKLHALATHSDDDDDNNKTIPFVFNRPSIFPMNLGVKKMVVLQEEKEGDLFVIQAFETSSSPHGVYITVRCIAPPGVSNFSCSLTKLNKFSTLRIGLMVKKIHKVVFTEEFEPPNEEDDGGDGFMLIPSYMLNGNEQWKMQVSIGRGYDYIYI